MICKWCKEPVRLRAPHEWYLGVQNIYTHVEYGSKCQGVEDEQLHFAEPTVFPRVAARKGE